MSLCPKECPTKPEVPFPNNVFLGPFNDRKACESAFKKLAEQFCNTNPVSFVDGKPISLRNRCKETTVSCTAATDAPVACVPNANDPKSLVCCEVDEDGNPPHDARCVEATA